MKRTLFSSPFLCRTPRCCDDREHVIPNLAVSPATVKQLADRGVSVTAGNQDLLFDSSASNGDFRVEPMFIRGMSREELWETEKSAQSKLVNALEKDVKTYGV